MNLFNALSSIRLSVDLLIFLDDGGQAGGRILESSSSQDQTSGQIGCNNCIMNLPCANFISSVFKNHLAF